MEEKNASLLKESGIGVMKSLITIIPFVGGLLNESLFEIRGRVKQNRINNFLQDLSDFMAGQENFVANTDRLKSEEFSDLFENVLSKVAKTRSTVKAKLFKQILLGQIMTSDPADTAELYLDIIDGLKEKQILILDGLNQAFGTNHNSLEFQVLKFTKELRDLDREQESRNARFDNFDNESFAASSQKSELKRKIEGLKGTAKTFKKFYAAKTYGIEPWEFLYLVQDLYSKGLLIDVGTQFSAEPFEIIEITQMGMDIVKFLKT